MNIPENLRIYNRLKTNDETLKRFLKNQYKGFEDTKCDAGQCISCHKCERVCPQGLPISKKLNELKNKIKE